MKFPEFDSWPEPLSQNLVTQTIGMIELNWKACKITQINDVYRQYTSYERDDVMIMHESKCVRFNILYTRSLYPSWVNRFWSKCIVYFRLSASKCEFLLTHCKISGYKKTVLAQVGEKNPMRIVFSRLFLFTHAYDPDNMRISCGSRIK